MPKSVVRMPKLAASSDTIVNLTPAERNDFDQAIAAGDMRAARSIFDAAWKRTRGDMPVVPDNPGTPPKPTGHALKDALATVRYENSVREYKNALQNRQKWVEGQRVAATQLDKRFSELSSLSNSDAAYRRTQAQNRGESVIDKRQADMLKEVLGPGGKYDSPEMKDVIKAIEKGAIPENQLAALMSQLLSERKRTAASTLNERFTKQREEALRDQPDPTEVTQPEFLSLPSTSKQHKPAAYDVSAPRAPAGTRSGLPMQADTGAFLPPNGRSIGHQAERDRARNSERLMKLYSELELPKSDQPEPTEVTQLEPIPFPSTDKQHTPAEYVEPAPAFLELPIEADKGAFTAPAGFGSRALNWMGKHKWETAGIGAGVLGGAALLYHALNRNKAKRGNIDSDPT